MKGRIQQGFGPRPSQWESIGYPMGLLPPSINDSCKYGTEISKPIAQICARLYTDIGLT